MHRSSALGKIAHEAPSNASPVLLESNGEEYLLKNTSYRSCKVTPTLMENKKKNFFKVLPLKEKPVSNLGNGCFYDRLGSASRSDAGVGCLGKGSSLAAHTLFRNDGSFSCHSILSKVNEGSKGVGKDGQHHCNDLHKKRGTHSPSLCILVWNM